MICVCHREKKTKIMLTTITNCRENNFCHFFSEYFERKQFTSILVSSAGLIPGLHPANERRRYNVTSSLIGWAQA